MSVVTLRALVALLSTLVALTGVSTARAASAPAGMFAVGDWAWPTAATLDREAARGLQTWRVPLDYGAVGSTRTLLWAGTDSLVRSMAMRGITPLFILTGCPAWQCPGGGPPTSGQALTDWKVFVSAAVRRYGPGGLFWRMYPEVPAKPVTAWQIYNEVNGAEQWPTPNAAAYGAFLAATAPVIRSWDPSAKVVLAGLPENMTISMKTYLASLYTQPSFKSSVDVIAVHGYAAEPTDVARILDSARIIMNQAGDGAKPLWVTEMSWATAGPAHPFVTTEAGQASKLRSSWDTMVACQARWKLQRTYWFGWRDPAVSGTDYWGLHNALNRPDGSAKPALAAFDEFTSGDPLPDGRAASCPLAGGSTIDVTIPETTITSGPSARTSVRQPPFAFASNEPGVRFECRADGSAWATCVPDAAGLWRPATPWAEGTHTLVVRAVDAQGNADASPATWTTLVDLTPPDTYVAGIWGNVATHVNSLTFSSYEPIARYECKVDSAAWVTCGTPFTATLANGLHTILVRSTDLAGNVDLVPAELWYKVTAG
jgi:hypothetical protein